MRNLLLISQDREVVDLVSRVAGRIGVELINPDTTPEAITVIQEEPPKINLIVLDLLPRGHQMAFIEQIKKCKGNVPLVALTQLEDQIAGSIACAKGADEAFQKPLSERAVEKLLRRFSAQEDSPEGVSGRL